MAFAFQAQDEIFKVLQRDTFPPFLLSDQVRHVPSPLGWEHKRLLGGPHRPFRSGLPLSLPLGPFIDIMSPLALVREEALPGIRGGLTNWANIPAGHLCRIGE